MRPVPVGTKGTHSITVGDDDLASKLDASLARVMSTPTMIGMMEMAAIDAIRSYYDAGETSVGGASTCSIARRRRRDIRCGPRPR
jgi:fluoroacetyl-CoA thioesterase